MLNVPESVLGHDMAIYYSIQYHYSPVASASNIFVDPLETIYTDFKLQVGDFLRRFSHFTRLTDPC